MINEQIAHDLTHVVVKKIYLFFSSKSITSRELSDFLPWSLFFILALIYKLL